METANAVTSPGEGSGRRGTPSTTAPPTRFALPPADPSAPPVEPYGVYRQGTVTLRGSVPSQELADAYHHRLITLFGEEHVVAELTSDPRVSGEAASIHIDERFPFPSGSVVYAEDFNGLLTLAASVLELLPESTLVITGHTESLGDDATNQALSVTRAALVADFMVRGGIPPQRVEARGAGESQPIADNATAEGRQANRRIQATLEGVRPFGPGEG